MHDAPAFADLALDLRGLDLQGIRLDQYCGLWAIDETTFSQLFDHVRRTDLRSHIAANAGSDVAQAAVSQVELGNSSKLSIISIDGTMTKFGSSLSSAGSTLRIRQELRSAARDPSVSGILLRIDSPGGTVAGTADLAADIRAANEQKPVWTFAEDMCASAAYWAGSQGEKFFANDATALIGSIGTFIGLYDVSEMAAKEGIKAVVIKTGALKGTGFPGTEITEEQRLYLQEIVDQTQEQFTGAAAAGRGRPVSEVKKWATGRTWSAGEALKMGLIDGIQSLDKTIAQLAKAGEARRKSNAQPRKAEAMSTATTPTAPAAGDNPAPVAATAKEITAACKGLDPKNGADAQFVLAQLDAGATLPAATSAWMEQLVTRNAGLQENLAKAIADKPAPAAAATAKLPGVDAVLPTGKTEPASNTNAGGTAAEQFIAAVAQKVAGGMSRGQATAAVVRDQPDLHKAYVAEAQKAR